MDGSHIRTAGSADALRPGRGNVEKTRRRVLDAARLEFSTHGFAGSRIEVIAKRAAVNKQALYYHFGSKEGLYLAALEDGYRSIRKEGGGKDFDALPPTEAMQVLIETFFDNVLKFRDVVDLVADENRLKGRHLKGPTPIRDVNRPFVAQVKAILDRGAANRVFREGIDPKQLWVSIVSLCQFYLGNSYTLSHILAQRVDSPNEVAKRRAHVVDLILSALRC